MYQKRYRLTMLVFIIISSLILSSCSRSTQTPVPTKVEPTNTAEQPPQPIATATSKPTEVPTAVPPTQEPTTPPTKKALSITFYQEPDNLNIIYTQMWFSWRAIDLFDVGLWNIDEKLNPVLEIATEFPSVENGGLSKDGRLLTVKLRKEATWSDGAPITAQDFIFTYQMYINEHNTVQTRYPYDTYIASLTAPDDYTLVISMTQPYVAWSTGLFRRILPKHILEPVFQKDGTLDNAEWNRNPSVGNGPFILKEWKSASHMIFEANPKYWRGRAKLDQIYIRIVPDTEAQMAAIQTGDTDIGASMVASDKPTIEKLVNYEMVAVPSAWIECLFFNLDPKTGNPAIQDVRVRQAFIQAIDRQRIIDELFYGLYKIPNTFWYDTPYEDPAIKPWSFDPEKSKSLLDEAGWVDSNGDGIREKDGVDLKLRYSTTSGNELREATQVVIQQMMADVGIGIEIVNYSEDVFFAGFGDAGPIALGEYDIVEWSDGAYDYPDPNYIYMLCSEIPTQDYPIGSNWTGTCIPELDELWQKQAITTDRAERIKMFYNIEKIMHEQVLWVGMRTDSDLWVVSKNLKNLRLSGVDCFWNAFNWEFSQ